MTGITAFLEVLAAAGVRLIFGNPGTTELPLQAALADETRFRYILGLHEIPVLAAAGGYAMARGEVAVVNVHTLAGLGNAMGMLANAHIEGTPILVTAGQQDTRLRFDEPVIEGDLVTLARPLVKWAAEVQRPQDIPNAVRRAIQSATTPPTGPVFLSLPIDVQMAEVKGLDLSPPWRCDPHVHPPPEALRRTAEVLASATHPVIYAGSRVTEAQAWAELADVAESLAAPVYAESASSHGRLPLPTDHPLYRGPLPLWSPHIRSILEPHDLLLVVGANLFRLYIHLEPANPIPPGMRIVHLDNNPREIGKNFSIEAGLYCDPKAGLADLACHIRARLSPAQCETIAVRLEEARVEQEQFRQALASELDRERQRRPLTPRGLMAALARVLPPNVAIVEEAPTTHNNLWEKLGLLRDPRAFFAHRGWGLGWGIGTALGVKLAWPHRPVLALLGDGASLYGIQGLWTAAHYQLPILFVIANNRRYRILEQCGEVLGLPQLHKAPGIVLDQPAIDYVRLAQAFGVEAYRVSDPEELTERAQAALLADRPLLLEAILSDS